MKRILFLSGIILITITLISSPVLAAGGKPGPNITVTLLNPPPDGVLVLGVGESYTFDILITSDEPFNSAVAKANMFYPGRGVFWHPGSDLAKQDTSALLHLTVIGKNSTADLPQVCDWPTPGTPCFPAGTAPQQLYGAARFQGGMVSYESFNFAIQVP